MRLLVKKKISCLQDINWSEFREKFPNQTASSMTNYLSCFHIMKNQPMFEYFTQVLPSLKHKNEKQFQVRRREEIVASYEKIRFKKT